MQIKKLGAAALLGAALVLGACDVKTGNGGGAAAGAGGTAARADTASGGEMDPAALNVTTDTQKIDSGGAATPAEDN